MWERKEPTVCLERDASVLQGGQDRGTEATAPGARSAEGPAPSGKAEGSPCMCILPLRGGQPRGAGRTRPRGAGGSWPAGSLVPGICVSSRRPCPGKTCAQGVHCPRPGRRGSVARTRGGGVGKCPWHGWAVLTGPRGTPVVGGQADANLSYFVSFHHAHPPRMRGPRRQTRLLSLGNFSLNPS